jgi:hypothetical protein
MKANLSICGVPIVLSLKENEEDSRANLDACLDAAVGVEKAKEFSSLAPRVVSHSAETRVLCVLQREFAIVTSVVDVVGCDDLTNTVVLFLELGNVVACGHFDDGALLGTNKCGVREMAKQLHLVASEEDKSTSLRAWIVGGFEDDKRNSANVLGLMLASLNALERPVDLQVVCAEKRNDVIKQGVHFPNIMGAA